MNKSLPVFAALAFGLAAVPASAQDAPPPPPAGEPEAFADVFPAPDAPEAGDPAEAPGGRGRRFGPRRGGPGERPGPGFAGDRPGFGFGRPDAGFGFIGRLLRKPEAAAKIGLAEDKAAALAATLEDLDAQIKAALEKMPALMQRQMEALDAAEIDEAAVLAAADEVWELRRTLALLQTRKLVAVKKTLDADQIAKARELLKETWKDAGGKGPRNRPHPSAQ